MSETLPAVKILSRVFTELNVPYLVGGSVASSYYGEQRLTQDVDFVADMQLSHIPAFVAALQGDFYADEESIRDAIQRRDSFSVLYLSTMYKADVFLMRTDAWSQEEMARRQVMRLDSGEDAEPIYVASLEDIILQKLAWFRVGGSVSDRQWRDVQKMLRIQAQTIDYPYLRLWAPSLQLTELLQRALQEAGVAHLDNETQ